MRRLVVLVLAGLLAACQTVPASPYRASQREALEQAGFTQVGDTWELGLEDRLLFDTDSSAVKQAQVARLVNLAQALVAVDIRGAVLVGHADATGSFAHNLALSRSRAEAVRLLLVQGGLDPARVQVEARGEEDPVASNNTAEGRAQNRRVVVIIRPADLLPL